MATTTNRKASSSIADLQAKMFAGKNDAADKGKVMQAAAASRRTKSFNPAILAFSQQLEGNNSPPGASKPEKKKDTARPAPGKLKKFGTVSTSIGGATKSANALSPPAAGGSVRAPGKAGKRNISSKLSALFGSGGSTSPSPFGGLAPGGGPARAVKSGNLMSPSVDFASVRHKRSQTVSNRAISSKLEGLLGAGPPIMIRPGGRPRPKSAAPAAAGNDDVATRPMSISVTSAPDSDTKDDDAGGEPDRRHLRSQSMMVHHNLQRPRVSRHRRARSRTRFKPKKTFISEELGVDVPKPAPDVVPAKPKTAATKVPKSPYDTTSLASARDRSDAAAAVTPDVEATKPKKAAANVPKSPYDTSSLASTRDRSDAAAAVMSDVVDAVVNNVAGEETGKGSEKKESGDGKEGTKKEQAPEKESNAKATQPNKAAEEKEATEKEKEKEKPGEKRDSNAMDTSSDSEPVPDTEEKTEGSKKTPVPDTGLEKSKNETASPKTKAKKGSGQDKKASPDSVLSSKSDKSAKSRPSSGSAYPRPKPKAEKPASARERPAAQKVEKVAQIDVPAPIAMDTSSDAPDAATQLTPRKRKTTNVLATTPGKRGSGVNKTGASLPTQVEEKLAKTKGSPAKSSENKASQKLEAPKQLGMATPAPSLQDIQKPLKSTKKTENDKAESDEGVQKEKYKTAPVPLGLAANGPALADLKKSLRSRSIASKPKSDDRSEEPQQKKSKTAPMPLRMATQAPSLQDLKKGLKKTSRSGKAAAYKKPESAASQGDPKSIESSAPLTVAQIIAARNKAKKG